MSARLVWTCHLCGQPIFGNDGYLGASMAQIRDEGPIQWVPWHDLCHQDDDTYSIDIDRIGIVAEARGWTAHLVDKDWYERSNWRDVMDGHGIDVTFEELTGEVDAETLAKLRAGSKSGPW